jgi:hypothetical protein
LEELTRCIFEEDYLEKKKVLNLSGR